MPLSDEQPPYMSTLQESRTTSLAPARSGTSSSTVLSIPTMDCAVEESELRRALEPIPGVRGLRFQLGKRLLTIDADPDAMPQVLRTIKQTGFNAQLLPAAKSHEGHPHAPGGAHGADHGHDHAPPVSSLRLGAALVLALAAEAVHWFAADLPVLSWLGLGLAVIAIGLSGLDVYRKGLSALRHGKLNINALMSVAVTGAFLIGQWPEAAMVMALYAIAELIEARAADRARNAIEGLVALAPEQADVQQPDGAWRSVPSAEVAKDSVVRIRPGERVPLDGVITQGASALDQSPVTGESLPVERTVGDAVFAGTINQTGELVFRVTATASGSTLARIIHAVEQAQATRAPTQRLRRPICGRLHARGVRAGVGGRARAAAAVRRAVAGRGLQGAGAAGGRMPVRAGHLDAGHGRQRAGCGSQARHPDQGRHVSGGRPTAQGDRARQDRHDHRRTPEAGRMDPDRRSRRSGRHWPACTEPGKPIRPSGVDGNCHRAQAGSHGGAGAGRCVHGARRAGRARPA